jgi:hypothetical protein
VQFAAVPPTDRDKILDFANRYGLLGKSVRAFFPVDLPLVGPVPNLFKEVRGHPRPVHASELKGRKPRRGGEGELFQDWRDEIRAMARAVMLRGVISQNDTRRLKKLIVRNNNHWILDLPDDFGYSKLIESRDYPLASDDLLPKARWCVQRWINDKLAEHVAPRVLWDVDSNKHVFRFMPKNLLGALWMQFARTVVGEVAYRQCKVCPNVLTISSDQGCYRADREFCSAACRQRDHRRKVREATDLSKSGKTDQQIAKHFDTSIKTIKGWLKKVR